jgi:hypothetical protein
MKHKTADNIRRFLRRHPVFFRLWRLLLTIIGHIVFCWERPQITKRQIERCYNALQPGDVIGVYSRRFPTGWLLPRGKWGVEHTAIYVGRGMVVEAVTPVVRCITLRRFLKPYDRVVIGRPLYGGLPDSFFAKRYTDMSMAQAFRLVDRPYDILFAKGADAVYCHETVALCMKEGNAPVVRTGDYWVADDLFAACYGVREIT